MNPAQPNPLDVRIAPAPSLPFAMVFGSVSFGAVSVLAYSIWAFRLVPGTAALYTTTALVYLGFAGFALSRLVAVPAARKRFPAIFALAFLCYAIAWCACWFGLRGRYLADFWGAAIGLAAMTWLLRRTLDGRTGFLPPFLVLLALHSAGYHLGGELYAQVRGSTGRLLWGSAHGLGFGAGLGYVLFRCQRQTALDDARHPS